MIEQVLERAYRAGVDDIHLIAALALHRRMTPAELRAPSARACSTSSIPTASTTTTPRTRTAIVELGETRHGEAVELSKRAAESDLLVYVNINLVTMDGGHKSVAGRPRHLPRRCAPTTTCTRCATRSSFMDPSKSASCTTRAGRQGEIVEAAVPIFHIETTLNNDMFDGPLSLPRPSPRRAGRAREQATFAALKRTTDRMPPKARRALFHSIVAPYAVTGVTAGAVDAVHEVTLERCADQQAVQVRRARPTSSPPGCPTSAPTTSTRS